MATVNTNWTSPASATLDKSTGGTIDETMTDAWSSNLYHLGGTVGHIGCRVANSAALSIANTSDTPLTFDTEQWDHDPNGAIHDPSSNSGRLTCRTAGWYLIGACISFAANGTGFRQVALRLNGTTAIAIVNQLSVGPGDDTRLTVNTVYQMAANDYFEVLVYQTSGGALDIQPGGNFTPYFWIAKV